MSSTNKSDAEDAEFSTSNEFMVERFFPIIDKLVAALCQRLGAYCSPGTDLDFYHNLII